MEKEKTSAPLDEEKKYTEETKKNWEEPTLEDVSQKIMAQPYIRFT